MDASVVVRPTRLGAVERIDAVAAGRLRGYVELAVRGLTAGYDAHRRCFPQTVRPDPAGGAEVQPTGASDRYTAMAALGLSRLDAREQRAVLGGDVAADLVDAVDARAVVAPEVGAKALAVWCATEAGTGASEQLLAQLCLETGLLSPRDTVVHAWALTALVGARDRTGAVPVRRAAEVLLATQRPSGIFPHTVSPSPSRGRRAVGREHVGSFADQVYPVQALARYFAATGDERALAAAERCARAIVAARGPAGQWWWHYDVRTGEVIEGYPVYSVHQHAMAPMVLLELAEAGGTDRLAAVLDGLAWLEYHPETDEELVCAERGVIWRKVGRREPRRAARTVRALATARAPGARLAWLDRLLPPGPVDRECRPYELGWLLYAWLSEPAAVTSDRRGSTS